MYIRTYEEMVESGDWPPTNRETIRFIVGFILGAFIGTMVTLVVQGIIN